MKGSPENFSDDAELIDVDALDGSTFELDGEEEKELPLDSETGLPVAEEAVAGIHIEKDEVDEQ